MIADVALLIDIVILSQRRRAATTSTLGDACSLAAKAA